MNFDKDYHKENLVGSIEMMGRIFTLLSSSLEPNIVLKNTVECACKVLDAESASLFLIDPKTDELYFEIAIGPIGSKISRMRLGVGEGIVGKSVMNREIIINNEVKLDPQHSKRVDDIAGHVTRHIICAPLMSRGAVIGALEAVNSLSDKGFSKDQKPLFEILSNHVAASVENSRLFDLLRDTFEQTVMAFVAAIEKRDPYTGGHTRRVLEGAVKIASFMDQSVIDLENLRMGAMLHDIGKIGVDDKILRKPGKLDDDEWVQMRNHPRLGTEIFQGISALVKIAPVVLYHHERWDGKGYPDGIAGNEIPIEARIIAVSDTFDAMTSDRPYRSGMDHSIAQKEIEKNADAQFDPAVVKAFLDASSNGRFPS